MATLPFSSDFSGQVLPDDEPIFPEDQITLPWAIDPAASWISYSCWVEVHLDAGMVLHKPLPQFDPDADTLASLAIDDPHLDSETGGVNITARASAQDYIQRMATSTYRFILHGGGVRVGYQIPIPGLMSVSGVEPVPGEIQRAYNVIVGNLAGIPLWRAAWELHYIVPNMPSPGLNAEGPVPFNPALHIRPDAKLPQDIRLPRTVPGPQRVALRTIRRP